MRVISDIANLDFHLGSVSKESGQLVVRSRAGRGITATVFVSASDIVDAAKALLCSPRALLFVLSAPFRRKGDASELSGGQTAGDDDINNPWR